MTVVVVSIVSVGIYAWPGTQKQPQQGIPFPLLDAWQIDQWVQPGPGFRILDGYEFLYSDYGTSNYDFQGEQCLIDSTKIAVRGAYNERQCLFLFDQHNGSRVIAYPRDTHSLYLVGYSDGVLVAFIRFASRHERGNKGTIFRITGDWDGGDLAATPTPSPTPSSPPGETITIPLLGLPETAKPLDMVPIPGGTFTMGSPEDERGRGLEWLPHIVIITRPYYLAKYEVTQAQWRAMMGANPATDLEWPPTGVGDDYPVYHVNWNDCQAFIGQLNTFGGGGTFRLPTEAEWEYACRAGTTTRFSFGDALECTDHTTSVVYGDGYCELADQFMWWWGNASPQDSADFGSRTVGLKSSNPWGLHDMHGNVEEWCIDSYEESTPRGPQIDPQGSGSGRSRVVRGGSWHGDAASCRSAARSGEHADDRGGYIGLRVLMEYEETGVDGWAQHE